MTGDVKRATYAGTPAACVLRALRNWQAEGVTLSTSGRDPYDATAPAEADRLDLWAWLSGWQAAGRFVVITTPGGCELSFDAGDFLPSERAAAAGWWSALLACVGAAEVDADRLQQLLAERLKLIRADLDHNRAQQQEELVKLWIAGKSRKVAAKKMFDSYGVSLATVKRWSAKGVLNLDWRRKEPS